MEENLSRVAQNLRNDGIEVTTHAAFSAGNVGGQIAGLADQLDVDMVVLGLIKRSRVGKALLRSSAQSVLLHSTKPVLSIRL